MPLLIDSDHESLHGMSVICGERLQALRVAANVLPAMVYERLPIANAAASQLGCMLLDDRALLTLEVLEGACHPPAKGQVSHYSPGIVDACGTLI